MEYKNLINPADNILFLSSVIDMFLVNQDMLNYSLKIDYLGFPSVSDHQGITL